MNTNRMDSGVLAALAQLSGNVKLAKKAAEAETSHPSGSAPDGDSPASTGEFASQNERDAKRTAGPQGVDSTGGSANPVKKQENLPAQSELNPGTVDGAVPSEIKPKQTISGGDGDANAKALSGAETGGGEAEGNVGGVGGPKFASETLVSELDAFLKEASTLIPTPAAPAAAAAPATAAPATPAAAPAAAPAGAAASPAVTPKIASDAAAELLEQEKLASAQIQATLAAAGVAADAPMPVKRAALVRAVTHEAVKCATAYIASLDPAVLDALLKGDFSKLASDDSSAVMPPASGGEGGEAGAAGAAAVAPAGGEAGAAGPSPEELIQKIIEAVQTGQLSEQEAVAFLQEAGLPQEVIAQIQAQLQTAAPAGGEGGGDPAAPSAAADTAAAAGAPAGA